MSRRVHDAKLETRTARLKLKERGKPYYRSIGPEIHLGYRKGSDARRWVARTYIGDGAYSVKVIGDADDLMDADGISILSFDQAQDKARALVMKQPVGPYTLGQAIDDYEGKDTASRLAPHVPASMRAKPIEEFTKQEIAAWHRGLAQKAPHARTKKGQPRAYLAVDMDDPEVIRKRRASANVVLTKLRAVLNHAFREDRVASNKAWSSVSKFKNVDQPRARYLTVAEAQRLINACDPDFRKLVTAALMTGCRYQEIARLAVADFHSDSGTLLIRLSKTGKSRHVTLSDEAIRFFTDLTAGRQGHELMLGRVWHPSDQQRPMRQACAQAKISPAISIHVLRHTWASLSVMAGMPLMAVARNLGHTDTKEVERTYAHLAPSYVQDQVRQFAPQFGIKSGNVKPIR